MDMKLAETIAEYADGEVYENYSGRGMYGEETTGVVVESVSDVLMALLQYSDIFTELMEDEEVKLPNNLQIDSMGIRTILY
jgi:hypothetical protein